MRSWVPDRLIAQTVAWKPRMRRHLAWARTSIKEPFATYQLHCAFPVFPYSEAVSRGAPLRSRTGTNPNDTSGVIRLARPANPSRTRIRSGGDLSYPGWQRMGATTGWIFMPTRLRCRTTARAAAQPLSALRTRRRDATAICVVLSGLPAARQRQERSDSPLSSDVVTAFRNQNSVILCTQISWRCHDDPENVPGNSAIPLPSVIDPHALWPSGSACAGTIMLVLRGTGHLVVSRLTGHQAAVNALQPTGHHPICRP